MVDHEKVIKGLECCRRGFCFACPYNDGIDENADCKQRWADDVLSLLKAQEPPKNASISSAIECLLHPQDADDSDMAKAIDTAVRAMRSLMDKKPRVMTLEDFENNPNVDQYGCLPCWMEYREEPKWDGWAEATVHTCVEYGRRPWTSRPTDEQREAEPWASDT